MIETCKTFLQLCVFRGSIGDSRGDNIALVSVFLVLMLLELSPLVSLFSNNEVVSISVHQRGVIWLLAFLWHMITVVFIFAVLKFKQLVEKVRQTVASYFGVFILIQIIGQSLLLLKLSSVPSQIQTLLLFTWLSWSCGVFGFVFRSALGTSLIQGFIVALLTNILSYTVALGIVSVLFFDTVMKIVQVQ